MSRFRGGSLAWWVAGALLSFGCQDSKGVGLTVATPPTSTDLEARPQTPQMTVNPVTPAPSDCTQRVPGGAEARLLTRLQYDNTVRDLLGGDLTVSARNFPEENLLLGFGNNADAHRASLLLSERHVAAAEELAAAAVARGVDQLLPCDAGDRSEGCVQSFISQFGYRAYRRPIREEESAPLLDLWRSANEAWGFDKALELVVETFLQSPQMLYRTESLNGAAEALPLVERRKGQALALDSYQIASRLSYLLWNTLPDAELFALADSDALLDVETVRLQARRMIDDERAHGTVADFYDQWLNLSSFAGLTRDPPPEALDAAGAPLASDAFNSAWQESLARFVQHTFWEDGGNVEALLSSQTVFVSSSLAGLYGLEAEGAGYTAVEDAQRAGILTQPGLMALLAHADQSAPVQRGKFVREQLLCKPLPPPPPDVDTTPPDPDPSATTRERFRQHSADQRCAACHRFLEGAGFGLEEFDQLGRFRTEEYGLLVDASGELLESGDPSVDGPFNGAQELAAKLAGSSQVESCLATQWFRYGMGRGEQPGDVCSLNGIKAQFAESGGDFRELLVSMTTTDVFRFRPLDDQDL
jgi:hypothetical protein